MNNLWLLNNCYADDFIGCPPDEDKNSVYCPVVDEGTEDAETDSETPRVGDNRDSRQRRRDTDVGPRA